MDTNAKAKIRNMIIVEFSRVLVQFSVFNGMHLLNIRDFDGFDSW